MQLCGNLSILWHCPSLGLKWKLTFSSLVARAEFSKFAGLLSAALSQCHLLGFETAQLEFHHAHKAHLTWHSRMSGSRWVIIPSWLSGSWRSFLYSSSVQFFCVFFGEGNGTPLMYSCLENAMDRGAWWAAVHGVAKSWTWLSNFTFTFHFHALEKEMATHSSVLAWRIPGTGEPGGLPSMGSCRVGHDWSDLAVAVVCVFLPPLLNIFCFC